MLTTPKNVMTATAGASLRIERSHQATCCGERTSRLSLIPRELIDSEGRYKHLQGLEVRFDARW